jgi:hypothetical protein
MADSKTLFAIIKNLRAYHLNHNLIGFHHEELLGSIRGEDILSFAEATKDNNPAYGELGLIPPIYLAKLAFPSIKKVLCHKDLGLNILRTVLAQQEIIWHEPIRVKDQLSIKLTIKDIYDTPAGEMLAIDLQVNKDDKLMIESVMGFIVRAKKKEKKRKREKIIREKEIFHIDMQTDKGQELKFADISGDHNFIHTNSLLAKMAGMPGRVMHGACLIAMLCATLLKNRLNNDITRLFSLRGRFARPVVAGDILTIKAYAGVNVNEILFDVHNSDDVIVFKDGIFRYR